MKKCIWCSRNDNDVNFNTLAHTFPQSLGGKNICLNVCDSCNFEFGKKQSFQPSVDLAVKEIFNLSRFLISDSKNISSYKRFSSEYFKVNLQRRQINIKMKYKLQSKFQENFARSFKRGIYKIFLEERERICGDSHSDEFNFIREFSRYNLNDVPLYYLRPRYPILLIDQEQLDNPKLHFTESDLELHRKYRLYEFYYGGYSYLLHTNAFMQDLHINKYNAEVVMKNKNSMILSTLVQIHRMEDLDFRYNLFNDGL
ncbi:HNH endonuclease [Chryseobacterium cheonjiense]|uniref:HNH endonuclease n=1 Tax=Chryseobacterium cheonjiense TaxID=2728845 RepID=A0A7Y0A388_9FLAO|nr:HNH endonuclease [Chryseobacterium cheonjiense]NML55776.1 HNH endonuclease [Chryseobacterium cheonjiense]